MTESAPNTKPMDDAALPVETPRTAMLDAATPPVFAEPTADQDRAAVVDAARTAEVTPSSSAPSLHADAGSATPDDDALAKAYAALSRANSAGIDDALTDLDRDLRENREDGHTALYTGTLRLWKVSELALGLDDLLASPSIFDEILGRLELARKLLPEDFRVPGFLGLAQVNAGLLGSNAALVEKGFKTLEEAIAQFPAYGHFLRAASTAGLPKDDPRFVLGLEDMLSLSKACRYDIGDAETAYRYPLPPFKAPIPHVCINEGIVPHVFEGIFMLYGDMANKAGWPAARVRALYRTAQTAPGYKNWPFAPMLEDRIARADDNSRLFTDTNPLNDPGMWVASGHICSGCHQER